MDQQTTGVIGLGLMGSALAERLLASQYFVLGYDIEPSCCEALAAIGGSVAAGPAEVASQCTRVLLSLPTTDVVERVLAEMGTELREGQIIIDTTTGEPVRTAELGAELAERGVDYLDATISGSSDRARKVKAIVIAGGRRDVFDACEDVFRCFAERWFHMGDWGSGARMKLVTNLVLGLNRAALAEGLGFARRVGLDPRAVLSVLAAGAAYSRAMDTKGEKMITGDFTPFAKLSQHLKDVRLILAEGARVGARQPLSKLHRQLLEELEAAGLGQADNSAIIRAFDAGDERDQ